MAVVIGEHSPVRFQNFQPQWHDSAPRSVVEKSTPDDPLGGWSEWQKHLAKRRDPELPPFLDGKHPPLLWGWPQAWRHDAIHSLLAAKKNKRVIDLAMAASRLLSVEAAATPDLPASLQLVGLAYALPKLSKHMSAEHWWQLVHQLYSLANDAQQHRVDWPADPTDVVRQQLLAGELPLALGYLFPEISTLRQLRKTARQTLAEGLIELTDGQGLPHARLLPVLGPLFALWTRCRWLGARLKGGAWSSKAEVQYEWLVRHALRFADADGRFLLTPPDSSAPAWTNELFHVAIALAGDRHDRAAAAKAISKKILPKQTKFRDKDLPNSSINSDWSCLAVLANGWSQSDIRLAVDYSDTTLLLELAVDGEQLVAGPWLGSTTCDDEPVTVIGEWDHLCWETSKEYAYLELGVELSHGLRLDRQLLLGRKDRVLFFIDTIRSEEGEPHRLHHTLQLPLEPGIVWNPEFETRDGTLVGNKLRAAAMPLALNEWRSDPRGGSLTAENGVLVLTQESNGRAMCCPLFLDLQKTRTKHDRTWRQLTVAEWMEILPHDLAVAYRAQSGNGQWLYYRSLGERGNRTFLGHNIAGEFTAGRFHSSGKYNEWIEVEGV